MKHQPQAQGKCSDSKAIDETVYDQADPERQTPLENTTMEPIGSPKMRTVEFRANGRAHLTDREVLLHLILVAFRASDAAIRAKHCTCAVWHCSRVVSKASRGCQAVSQYGCGLYGVARRAEAVKLLAKGWHTRKTLHMPFASVRGWDDYLRRRSAQTCPSTAAARGDHRSQAQHSMTTTNAGSTLSQVPWMHHITAEGEQHLPETCGACLIT